MPTVQTSMGQTERPQSEVGGGVGDAAEAVLDGVDGLVYKQLTEVKLKAQLTLSKCASPARPSLS